MDRKEILRLLMILNEKLKSQGIRGEIILFGGAVMCLCLKSRVSTKDIDAIFEPKSKIYEAALQISEEEGVSKDWLNDGVKGFISENNDIELYESFSNLDIYNSKYEYLFAMKCMACRLDEEFSDKEDIEFLISYLKIKDVEEAENIILKYFPPRLITPKTHYMLKEFFS